MKIGERIAVQVPSPGAWNHRHRHPQAYTRRSTRPMPGARPHNRHTANGDIARQRDA